MLNPLGINAPNSSCADIDSNAFGLIALAGLGQQQIRWLDMGWIIALAVGILTIVVIVGNRDSDGGDTAIPVQEVEAGAIVSAVEISRSAKSGHKLVPVEESTVQEWTEIHEAVRQASHISRPMPRVPGRSADTFIDPTTISHAMTQYGFTVDDVWDVFDQAGFPEDVWDHAFCIVWHESNFRADNVGDTTIKYGPSLGWFQIDIYFWPIDRDQAFDPVYNATYAFTNIYGTHADPWQPWSTERTYCSTACRLEVPSSTMRVASPSRLRPGGGTKGLNMTQRITKVHVRNGAAIGAVSMGMVFLTAVGQELAGGQDVDGLAGFMPLIIGGAAAVLGIGQHQAIQADEVRATAETNHANLAGDVETLKSVIEDIQLTQASPFPPPSTK